MTILLQRLVEYAWIFYVICIIGIIPYVARALTAQRERRLSLFTLEREAATAQVVRSWMMVFVFIAIGVAIFVGTTFVLPSLSIDLFANDPEVELATPTPSSGVQPLTPTHTPTLSPTLDFLEPTVITDVVAAASPAEPAEPTETPTLEPTETPVPGISGGVNVRFGDFAELDSFSLPAVEFNTAQPIPLTLYWRGLAGTSPLDYWVFTHLLAEDGHLVAQHDGAPAGGTRPISGWGTGESIVDMHTMVFEDPAYTGPARISVGLYDPAIGRVLTGTGADSVILSIAVTIVP